MVVEHSSTGDPVATLELLWGVRGAPQRGPQPRLEVEDVVRAAIDLADADGLSGLSMRRLARHLGVGTMSLYRYVPSKAELVDVMVDRVCAEAAHQPYPEGGWRARLEHVARTNLRLHRQHPWLLEVFTGRPPLGPGVLSKYDHELRAVEGTGLSDLEADTTLTIVLDYVRGAAVSIIETQRGLERSGKQDLDWWQDIEPRFTELFDPDQFPLAARIGRAAATHHQAPQDPQHAFGYGLERLLDGIQSRLSTNHD